MRALPRVEAMSHANRSASTPAMIDVAGCGVEVVLPSTSLPLTNSVSTTMPEVTLVSTPPA